MQERPGGLSEVCVEWGEWEGPWDSPRDRENGQGGSSEGSEWGNGKERESGRSWGAAGVGRESCPRDRTSGGQESWSFSLGGQPTVALAQDRARGENQTGTSEVGHGQGLSQFFGIGCFQIASSSLFSIILHKSAESFPWYKSTSAGTQTFTTHTTDNSLAAPPHPPPPRPLFHHILPFPHRPQLHLQTFPFLNFHALQSRLPSCSSRAAGPSRGFEQIRKKGPWGSWPDEWDKGTGKIE